MYYELKGKTFVLVNRIKNVRCFDLYKDFYVVGLDEKILFYKKKELYNESEIMVEKVKFSKSGLFVCAIGMNKISMFDCNGNLIFYKIFNGIKDVQFLGYVEVY